MNCQICGRRSAPGARLCADCYAARKRAYDATITQPLAVAGAGRASRTLSRLRRRSESSPEAKAGRAAKKAKQAAAVAEAATIPSVPAPAQAPGRSRSALWVLLSALLVLAAIAGWHLPTRAPIPPQAGPATSVMPLPSPPSAVGAADPRNQPPQAAAVSALTATTQSRVDREPAPAPAPIKPVPAKHPAVAPRPAAPATETAPAVEIVRLPRRAAVSSSPPPPMARADPWQEMKQAIGRCPDEGFLGRVVCEQRVRLQYCEGRWGQVPQCPGGPSVDHR